MDFNKFKTQLAQSTKQAFLEIYTQNPEQDIYAFALCNNDSTISIHPSANSIEYLNEVADENDFHFYKFEPSEWKFEQHQSKRLFDEINENCKKIVNEHDDDEDWFYHFQNQINDACIEVLENLKAENFFQTETGKDIFLNFSVIDEDLNAKKQELIISKLNHSSYKNDYVEWMKSWNR